MARAKRVRELSNRPKPTSAGHQLGQAIGDWWEEYVVLPLLQDIADSLRLHLDTRFVARTCRGDKVTWPDQEGNVVDYDFVLELGGSDSELGTPVAFVECFWRRGSRHSKDKARDDSGKLTYMRDCYPTARLLGIAAAGSFTEPARELVRSRQIALFYVSKERVVEAFRHHGLVMDYPDTLDEERKSVLAAEFLGKFRDDALRQNVAATLRNVAGDQAWKAYSLQIRASLSAPPAQIIFVQALHSTPVIFEDVHLAADFLADPRFLDDAAETRYIYSVVYSDGSEFIRELSSLDTLRSLHGDLTRLADHMAAI